jgi:hypothetical protein
VDNKQIKENIENAKRAFIASRNQQRSISEVNKFSENDRQPTEKNIQKDILDRVTKLMNEASQTDRGRSALDSNISDPPRPFWAQSNNDLSSFEKWERQQNMSNTDDAPENTPEAPPLATTSVSQPAPVDYNDEMALSAIRDEVIGRIDNSDKPEFTEKILELSNKLQYLEGRIDKHQQDIAALLQLVRQITARQKQDTVEEHITSQKVASKSSGAIGLVFFVVCLIFFAVAGWLFWMNPVLMMSLATMLVNKAFTLMMNIVSLVGLV